MSRSLRTFAESYRLPRLAALSVVAVALSAYAIAITEVAVSTMFLGLLLAGVAIVMVVEVHRAVSQLRSQSKSVRQSAAVAERHYVEVLGRIVKVVESRDKYWAGHSQNVGRLAGLVARQLGLPEERREQMIIAGELHDIGLLAVPESVILSHSRFGVEDFRHIQTHSVISHDVLKPLEMLHAVLPAIRAHHEKFNGTGYPDGLRGEKIPLGGRILAVADAYDAMTHDRPHRQAVSPVQAFRELRRCTPAGFDPQCVEALAAAMNIPKIEDAISPAEPVETVAAGA